MLKIYNAYNNRGMIRVDDYIGFYHGIFDSGYDGIQAMSGDPNVRKANYELASLKQLKAYLTSVKLENGYPTDYKILKPSNYELLQKEYHDVQKTLQAYEQYGLNEEGILLFTYYIHLGYSKSESIEKVFGKHEDIGLYLIMPNASFTMTAEGYPYDEVLEYEVLQSKNPGKRLALVKMNRKMNNGKSL